MNEDSSSDPGAPPWATILRGGAEPRKTRSHHLDTSGEHCGMLQATGSSAVVCVSMDDAAMVLTIVYTKDLSRGILLATQIRSDVEHKK
jgi:hypothetical protein